MKIGLKTFMPVVALSSLGLVSCYDSVDTKAQKFMEKHKMSQTQIDEIYNTEYPEKQYKLDSIAYRDIFMATQAASDSDAVDKFNQIAATVNSKAYHSVDRIRDIEEKLVNAGITADDMERIKDNTKNYTVFREADLTQHLADDWAYRKFFNEIGVMDTEVEKKCDEVSKEISPAAD